MDNTIMYQLTETSKFMMSFVIVTRNNNVIVIDGGHEEDMPLLKEYVGGRHISAWILTHAHSDHIGGFVSEFEKNGAVDFDIERIYYNFPSYSIIENKDVLNYERYCRDLNEVLPAFNKVLPEFEHKTVIPQKGDSIKIDEVLIEFIYTYRSELTTNLMNDSSLVFKLTTPDKSVMFLGDIGPEGGDFLFRESRHLLKADIVQMAHHGHSGCGLEVYAEIAPEACMWCCPDWLYDEPEVIYWYENATTEDFVNDGLLRMYGTKMTRKWMDILGVKTHYITKDGTQTIIL